METELKLTLQAEDVAKISGLNLLKRYGSTQQSSYSEQRLISTYYDTSALALKTEGITLRIRDKGGEGWVRTVKSSVIADDDSEAQNGGALHRRNEFEVPLESQELDYEELLKLKLAPLTKALLAEGTSEKLTPKFTTDFVRKQWLITSPAGVEVEFALDFGRVYLYKGVDSGQDEDEVQICEIELELCDSGDNADPAFLFQLRDELSEEGISIEPGSVSKAARGFSLL